MAEETKPKKPAGEKKAKPDAAPAAATDAAKPAKKAPAAHAGEGAAEHAKKPAGDAPMVPCCTSRIRRLQPLPRLPNCLRTRMLARKSSRRRAPRISLSEWPTFWRRSTTPTSASPTCRGNILGWSSAGKVGFQRIAQEHGVRRAASGAGCRPARRCPTGCVKWKSASRRPGSGRESAIRALQAIGLEISAIKDVTPVPHNGCRPRKKRRV